MTIKEILVLSVAVIASTILSIALGWETLENLGSSLVLRALLALVLLVFYESMRKRKNGKGREEKEEWKPLIF